MMRAIRRSQFTDDLHKYQLCENDVKWKNVNFRALIND